MKYQGFFKHVNETPKTEEYIEIFCSDWNKDHWAFYASITKDNYEQDIQDIQSLITKLNYRDGDVYIELIDHSPELEHFYHYIYESNNYTHSPILDPRLWEILEDKGDDHFYYFEKLNGSTSIDDLENTEFIIYNDWYEVLETLHPDIFKVLDESNALSCFDIEHFYNCTGMHEIGEVIVEEV